MEGRRSKNGISASHIQSKLKSSVEKSVRQREWAILLKDDTYGVAEFEPGTSLRWTVTRYVLAQLVSSTRKIWLIICLQDNHYTHYATGPQGGKIVLLIDKKTGEYFNNLINKEVGISKWSAPL